MRIFYLTILLAMVTTSYSQVFTEDFENGGTIPSGWTQEYENLTIDWAFQAGGQSGHPAAAHGGSYNALFTISTHANDGAKTKLISPTLSLTSGNDYYLTFYYANELWGTDQDTLKVYYKASGVWYLIETFDVNQVSWKKRILPIPNTATNIAFEGEAEYGYGVCIDDVRIDQITRNPTITTCDDLFVDNGGVSGNYTDNQSYIQTYTSGNNSCIRAIIDYYEIESDFDYLYIYDGTDLTGELLQVYTGSSTNTSVSSTLDDNGTAFYGLSGSLTFYFYSDAATNDLGWEIALDCPDNCVSPACSDNALAADDCSSPTPICNLNGYCGNTGSDYTADHTELDYDSTGVFCGTIENNSWLTFVADSTIALIDVWVYNCTGIVLNGNIHGIQIEVFAGDCNGFTAVSNCWSPNKEANGQIRATGLTPGDTYYIMIDGWGADDCEYSFAASANSGIIVASAGIDQTICEGQNVNISASGGTSISWISSPVDPSLSGQENNASLNISPSQTTIYTATVSGSNPNCPGSTADVVVYVNQADASFTGLDAEYCEEDITVALTGNYSAGVFSGTGITANSFNTSDAGIGSHDITYTFDYSVITVFEENFDGTVTGWTHGAITGSDSWQLGTPKGGNGDQASTSSYPDPVIDHTSSNTDNFVYGQGLSDTDGAGLGGYNNSSNEWLKSPVIDCSSLSNTTLSFWRYANLEPNWDEAYVEISTNGTTWDNLGETLYPQDDRWVFRSINISSYADGHSTVYIRWRSVNDGATTYSGWNIDDVKVTGVQAGGTCVSTDVQTTQVYQPVSVSVSQTTANICANDTYNASGTVSGGISTGYWTSTGSGSFDNTTNLNTVYTPSAADISNGSVVLTLFSDNPTGPCIPEAASINLIINPLDDAYFEYSSNTFCNSGTSVLPTTSPATGGSYSSSPSGLIIDASTGEIDIANSTVNTAGYDVTYTTTGACPDTYTSTINIDDSFDAEFSYNNTEYCQSDANPIPNHTTGSDGTYTSTTGLVWGTGVGEIDLANSTPGTYNITNTIPASGTCPEATHTQTVTIYQAPLVSIIEAEDICSNENIVLHGSYAGSTQEIIWSSSNGTGTFSNINDTISYYTPSSDDISNGLVTFTISSVNTSVSCSEVSQTVDVTINPQAQIIVNYVEPHCNLSDGSISISATGGTSPYSYLWEDGSTSYTLSDISSGVYSVTVNDYNNCDNDTAISLPDLNAGTIQLVASSDVSCFGYNDGSLSISMNGGTPEFTYEWNNGNDSAINPNLTAGSYIVTVTDTYNCKVIEEFIISSPDELQTINSVYNVKCFGGNDGNIVVNSTGGTPDYLYSWEHTSDNISTLNNLSAGTYYLTLSDNNLCTHKDTFEITEPNEILLEYISNDITCSEKEDGSIAISVEGGITPYSLLWSTGNTTDSVLYNLDDGNYSIKITDANNCSLEEIITINTSSESCLQIPSVFTPNGDGFNDKWEIKGCELFETIRIDIFNRWGDEIFHFDGKGYEYNDASNQWNGTYNNSGEVIDLTTFVYIIYLSGEDEPYNGTVTIVR